MKQVTVYIGDGFYTVSKGDILKVKGLTAQVRDCLLFQSKLTEKVFGLVTAIEGEYFTVEIINVEILKETSKEVSETETTEIVEGNEAIDFDSFTKKELIAFVKENKLNIETNKVNKATLLESIKAFYK